MVRVRLLCGKLVQGPLPISVYPVRLDSYGVVFDCGPSTLRDEQHLRGHDLVLSSRCSGHYKRRLCIHLRYHLWSDSAHRIEPKEDRRGLRRRMDLYDCLWNRTYECDVTVFILYMSCQCKLFPRVREVGLIDCKDLGANIFTGLNCTPNPVFVPHAYTIPLWTKDYTFYIQPMQFHTLVFATFASLIAPFGKQINQTPSPSNNS